MKNKSAAAGRAMSKTHLYLQRLGCAHWSTVDLSFVDECKYADRLEERGARSASGERPCSTSHSLQLCTASHRLHHPPHHPPCRLPPPRLLLLAVAAAGIVRIFVMDAHVGGGVRQHIPVDTTLTRTLGPALRRSTVGRAGRPRPELGLVAVFMFRLSTCIAEREECQHKQQQCSTSTP